MLVASGGLVLVIKFVGNWNKKKEKPRPLCLFQRHLNYLRLRLRKSNFSSALISPVFAISKSFKSIT